MSETKKDGATPATTGSTSSDTEKKKIEISVDTTSMEAVIERLKKKEEEAAKLSTDLEKAMTEKQSLAKTLEEKEAIAEDLEAKLTIIAEKEFNAKKAILMDECKKLVKDAERVKKIEEGIKSPEDLKATQFMLETLNAAMKEGAEAHKKLTEEEEKKTAEEAKRLEEEKKATSKAEPVGTGAGGQATLAQATGTSVRKEYDSHEAMIRDLRRRSHSDDPEEKAIANAILDELFLKWSHAVKLDYEGKRGLGEMESTTQPSLHDIQREGGAAMPKARQVKKE